MRLNFRVESVKGKMFTVFLVTAVVGAGFVVEANHRASVLQDRLTQQEEAFMKLADEFWEYREAAGDTPVEMSPAAE